MHVHVLGEEVTGYLLYLDCGMCTIMVFVHPLNAIKN